MAKHGEPLAFLMDAINTDTDECIIWPFAKARGYGKVLYEGFVWQAHRLVCFLKYGDPPSGDYEAAHKCGNASCVNKKHVRWATHQENMHDRKLHGTHDKCGRKRLLNAREVLYVWSMKSEKTAAQIASDLGVYEGTIRAIFMGKTYKDFKPQGFW
jgi:hypothetical protein